MLSLGVSYRSLRSKLCFWYLSRLIGKKKIILNTIYFFGWAEDNNRAIPSNEEIFAKVQAEEQRNFLLEKLNNKYTLHLRGKYV